MMEGNYYPVEVENHGKKPELNKNNKKRMSQSKIKLIAIIILAVIVLTSATVFIINKILNPELIKVLVEPSLDYEWLFPCGEGLLITLKKDKCGLIDKYGNIVVPLIYGNINEFNNGLAVVRQENYYHGKCGVIDKEGNIVLDFIYDGMSTFFNGLAIIYNDNKCGAMNQSLEVVIPLIYDELSGFNPDGFAAARKDTKWGIVDNTGKVIIPFEYDNIVRNIGYGFFATTKDSSNCLLNTKGEIVLPAEYDWIDYFYDDMAIIQKSGKYGFIDTSGEIVIPMIYDIYAGSNEFCDGMAAIYIPDPDTDRLPGFINGNSIWGFIDKTGEIVITPQFDRVESFSDGMAAVGMYEENINQKWVIKWGYINKNGEIVVPMIYDYANPFVNGLAVVGINDPDFESIRQRSFWVIDKKGNVVVPVVENGVNITEDGRLILARKDGKEGILNRKGDVILPFEYDNIYINSIKDNLLCVEKNGLWGILEVRK